MAASDPTAPVPTEAGTEGAQVATIAQYIKDLSVESPNAPTVFQWQVQPQLDVQFNINISQLADDVHECALKVEVAARSDQGAHFLVDLTYAGVFALRNIPEDSLPVFLLVEAPRLLFPFARQIIADAVQNTGFPPLLLDPIDFAAAYMQQMEAAQGAQPNGSGEAPVADAPATTDVEG